MWRAVTPELGLDVRQGRAHANPELAVTRVAEELLGVAASERADGGRRPRGPAGACEASSASSGPRWRRPRPGRLRSLRSRRCHRAARGQHGIGLAVAAEPGQVGKGTVRTEDVVGVVAGHLEAAGGHDEPVTGEGRADHVAPSGRPVRGLRPGRSRWCRGAPSPWRRRPGTRRSSGACGSGRSSALRCSPGHRATKRSTRRRGFGALWQVWRKGHPLPRRRRSGIRVSVWLARTDRTRRQGRRRRGARCPRCARARGVRCARAARRPTRSPSGRPPTAWTARPPRPSSTSPSGPASRCSRPVRRRPTSRPPCSC